MSNADKEPSGLIKMACLGVNGGAIEIPAECHSEFQKHFSIYKQSAITPYSDFAPAYAYGYRMATQNPEHAFERVEEVLKADFMLGHPNCDWEKMRGAVRYGWMRARQ